MPGGVKVEIDLWQLEQLSQLQVTDNEYAAYYGMATRAWALRKKNRDVRAAIDRGREKGKISLRRAQFKGALEGSVPLLIWLGKQYLGQIEKKTIEKTVTEGRATREMPDEELEWVVRNSSDGKTVNIARRGRNGTAGEAQKLA